MAPMILESEVDDDDNFVRTISDNEQDLPLLEEEGVAGTEPAARQAPWENKRKRQTQEGDIGVLNKKQKKEQRRQNRNTTLPNGSVSHDDFVLDDEEDETWDAQGEDDGAMDSNFEFQIGTVGTQVLEVFDGWGEEGGGVGFTARETGDKKGVDIDELIARRRKVGNKEQLLDDDRCNDQDHYNSWDAVSIDSGKDDDTNAEDEVEDEDETIADDAFGMGADEDEGNVDGGDGHSIQKEEMSESDEGAIADAMPNPEELEDVSEDEDDAEESAKKIAFFAPEEPATKINAKDPPSSKAFQSMNLSRPILRGLALVGFTDPTPIQIKAIPIALLAKDVVGGAVTGSGKTGAFIIPILERLLHRPKRIPTSRVAILLPTRELAVQCFNVAKKLASFTDITFALLTGGFSLREQESVLRSRPDVIIATPGRFIDHMRNSASFTVDTLEILVLDEADRILEDGFADELNEILTTIPRSRQTMLFSATMTDRVDKLIRVGLNRPVRLIVDARKQTVVTLTQEFVRLRPGREDKRLGYLSHLCSDVFTERVIIFFRQKKEAHRVRVIFGLLGIRVAELHGSMTQEQRISSLTSFRNGHATHLLATDLASRGLDVPNVAVVLNYEAPQSHEIYLHRVGRTARAGRGGRACTIAAESDRKVVKQAVKAAKAQGAKIVSRVVDPTVADGWASKVTALDGEIEAILREEKEEKLLSQTDMVIRKGENIVAHEGEINARPRRTWFESEKEKLQAKKAGKEELNGRIGLGKIKSGSKLSNKDKKALDDKRDRVEGRAWKKGKVNLKVGTKTKEKHQGKGNGRSAKAGRGRQKPKR